MAFNPRHPPAASCLTLQLLHNTHTTAINRFDIRYSGGPPNTAALLAIATAVSAAWGSNMKSLLYSGWSMGPVTCIDATNPTTPVGVYTPTVIGTRAGTAPQANVRLLVLKQANRRIRGGKGKNFFPYGVTGDQSSNTQWTAGLVSSFNTVWAAFIAALTGSVISGITLGVETMISYYGPPTIPNTGGGRTKTVSTARNPAVPYDVLSTGAVQTFGSQRRALRS